MAALFLALFALGDADYRHDQRLLGGPPGLPPLSRRLGPREPDRPGG